MIRTTKFVQILEDIHKRTDMRYGQIINNALQSKLGRKDCDCGKDSFSPAKDGGRCTCPNFNGAAYDIFYTWDEDLTEILEEFRFRLFPELKRIRLVRPKKPIGTLSKKELKRMQKISD